MFPESTFDAIYEHFSLLNIVILLLAFGVSYLIYLDLHLRKKLRAIQLIDPENTYNDKLGCYLPQYLSPVGDPICFTIANIYRTAYLRESDYVQFAHYMKTTDPNLKTVATHLFGRVFAISWNPEIVSNVLFRDKANWGKITPQTFKVIHELLGESVIISEGEKWKHQRAMMNPSFALKHVRNIVPGFVDVADKLVDKLQSFQRESGTFEVYYWVSRCTLDILGSSGFHLNFDSMNAKLTDVYEAYEGILRGFANPWNMLSGWDQLPFPGNIEYQRSKREFWKWATGIVEQKRKAIEHRIKQQQLEQQQQSLASLKDGSISPALSAACSDDIKVDLFNEDENILSSSTPQSSDNEQPRESGSGLEYKPAVVTPKTAAVSEAGFSAEEEELLKRDILDFMVEAHYHSEEYGKLTDIELLQNILLFFMAGHETASGTLTFALDFLARHPDVQSKLRDEVLSVFPDNEVPTYNKLNELTYMNQVIHETLRLRCPVVQIRRVCKKETNIMGYHFPKGSIVAAAIANLHRDKDFWGEDAEEFRPERWNEKKPPGVSYMPFGYGPRMCIGVNFANIEMRVVLARLLQRFVFAPHSKHLSLCRASGVTVRPQEGYLLSIENYVPSC